MSRHTNANNRTSYSLLSSLKLWLPPLVWMAVIFVLSGTPSDEIPKVEGWDVLLKKGGHMVAYAMLTVLLLRALETHTPTRKAAWLAVGIAVLYAMTDEYHQTFVPGRKGTGIDILVDTAGALVGLRVWRWTGR